MTDSSLTPAYARELDLLQQELATHNPTDVLQFCANYFNSKLELQRCHLWQQEAKAQAAGINLFPAVSVNSSNAASRLLSSSTKQPSFKSPFSDNDPHANHHDDPLGGAPAPGSAITAAEPNAPDSSANLFKSYNVGKTSAKHVQDAPDPNDPTTETGSSKNTSSSAFSSFSNKAASGFKFAPKFPIAFNANRRTSVSAETINPNIFKSSDWKPPVNDLTPEQREELAGNLASNFLFRQLDANSKKTVVAALTKKLFAKDSEIIKQGDEGDYFYIIESGTVDFYVNGTMVSSAGEGASFGELALMYNSPRAATVVATSNVTCWALDRSTFRHIILEGTFNRRLMYEDFLKDVPILKVLSNTERSKLADALSSEIFHKGDQIVKEGQQGENFYFIESGNCNVIKEGEGVVAKLGKGDYFGELALLNDKPRAATVEAVDNVIVATLGKSGFSRLLGPAVEVLKQQDPTAH